jgi:taurine dioxygenase
MASDTATLAYETIKTKRLTPHIGAEISGIDLTKPLNDAQVRDIRKALLDNLVIFFRDQPVDVPTLKAFGQSFGKLHISPLKGMDAHPEVRPLHADHNSKHVSGEDWHSDLTCDPVPPMGSILHLHTLPQTGGDTIWTSMYAAYDALSPRLQSYLEGLTATHDGGPVFRLFNPSGKFPVAVHPVIVKHPETKRKVIFVNRAFTSHINELPPKESAAVLAFLYSHCESPLYAVRFQWRKHSIAFWDNRCTQHFAVWDYYPQTRSGDRVQIEGANPPWG